MGVRGSGGVGGGIPRHRPSHIAYYVALVGILSLLAMLLLYFFYFFIKKVKKYSAMDTPTLIAAAARPPQVTAPAYPVQPVVREGATEMARLCSQVPPSGKGGTVYPLSTSPAAIRADTGDLPPPDYVRSEPDNSSVPGPPVHPDANIVSHETPLIKPAPPVIAINNSVIAH